MFRNYKIWNYDFKLIFMVLALSAIGVIAIGSAEETLQSKQFFGVIAGVALMLVLSFIDYHSILRLYWLIYAGNILLLSMVMFMGEEHKGAQRWVEIGSITFQPSETAKILLILFFAQFIMKYKEKLNSLKILAACIVLVAVPWVLIYEQPDLSTSIMVLVIFCVILFAGGISWKYILGALAVGIPALIVVVSIAVQPDQTILTQSQQNRILSFIDPEAYATTGAYQQLNSVMAIGSGQLDGKGYKNNEITSVKNGDFISEAQTDFIFAVIGEEFGFKGCVVVIVLMMGTALECVSIGRRAKDMAGRIIAAGMGGLIAFQGFFNIGVTTFILPNTGLPLPFVSYGLTSLMSCLMGIGFVLNVRLQSGRSPGQTI
ncbi:MAG: rod shape-determining protein RodA [Butyrivibrio sp.]|nr:rod shape-determining protein RodA [Muribaculum sp.]MCM1552234.1 rod shape-determining protein RodA [Butyrivibrio sp.]